jgi:RHS repeat-associated protein
MGEYDGTGALIQEIVWLGDTPVASVRLGSCGLSIFYIHTDSLNTPRKITRRSTSEIVWQWNSDPFGNGLPNENPSGLGAFSFNLRFPGQYYDQETGLNQNYFRDYDPATGRYVESDPSGLGGGINPYGYSGANPISNFDPLGLYCTSGGGSTTCSYPGGPSFKLPTPAGFPADINSGYRQLYHKYDVQRALGCADPQDVLQALISNPTPGNPNPATPGGTPNNAPAFLFGNNPVTSYLTTDLNTGAPLVVNITGPGSAFSPGYVAREVVNGVAHTYGEGLNPLQSPSVTAELIQNIANQLLWGRQMGGFIAKAKQKCGCQK